MSNRFWPRYFGAVGKAPCVCPRCQYPPPRLEETGRPLGPRGQDGIRASLREFGPPDEGLPPGSVDVPNMYAKMADEPVGSEILLQFLSLNAIICFLETCLIKQIKSLDFEK